MADKEKYVIKIQGQLVEVSPEVCNTTNTPCALPEAGYTEIRAGETRRSTSGG